MNQCELLLGNKDLVALAEDMNKTENSLAASTKHEVG